MRVWNNLVVTGMVLCLAACGISTPPVAPSIAQTPQVVVTPELLPGTDVATRIATPLPVTPEATRPLTLTLWVPEEFAPGAERGGDVLQARVAAFEAANPGVRIDYQLKAPYGKGGMADWLTQLQELMPDRLPDAAIVDSRDVARLEALGLLQPLQQTLPSGMYWDLFPPAQRMARHGGVWNNQPLALDLDLLAYDTRRVSAPPLAWQDVLSTTTPIAFAADSTDAFLLQYLHDGGSLDPTAHPALDSGVMQNVLAYFQRTRANGNLGETAAAMQAARDILPLFVSGQVPLAQIRARDFLSERARLPNAAASWIPTHDGRAAGLASGWTYVVLTPNAARQRAAADYLLWLNDAAFLGAWTRAAQLIPAGTGAFAEAFGTDAYAEMLRVLLNESVAAPPFEAQAPYANAWHTAVQAVLTGQLAPDDAAYRALQSIAQ